MELLLVKTNKQILIKESRKRKAAPRKSKKEDTKRPRRQCPVEGCSGYVTELKKHFRQVHPGMSFKKLKIPSRARRVCPLCGSATSRMDLHLTKQHGMSRGMKNYEEAMAAAPLYVESEREDGEALLHQALNEFCDQTRDRAGGVRVKAATAASHRSAVRMYLKTLDHQSITNLELIGRPGQLVDQQVEGKTHKPATLQLYLGYLSKFISFLAASQKWNESVQIDSQKLQQVALALKKIGKSLEADAGEQTQEMIPDKHPLDNRAKQIGQYLNGPRQQMMEEILQKDKLTVKDQCNVRDIIIVSLTLLNFKRAGDVPHIKITDFQRATIPEDGSDVEVNACTHTLAKRGLTSSIFIPKKYYKMIVMYVHKCRGYSVDDTPYLFTTLRKSKGEPRLRKLEATAITRVHMAEWTKAFGGDSGMTATLARKVPASLLREMGADRDDQAVLARHMVHRLETADTYYDKASWSVKRRQVVDRLRTAYKETADSEEEEK